MKTPQESDKATPEAVPLLINFGILSRSVPWLLKGFRPRTLVYSMRDFKVLESVTKERGSNGQILCHCETPTGTSGYPLALSSV